VGGGFFRAGFFKFKGTLPPSGMKAGRERDFAGAMSVATPAPVMPIHGRSRTQATDGLRKPRAQTTDALRKPRPQARG